ncbi:MAG TPA: ester cyclase [Candidatus Limnocylindria bacterium]|nr:ester cyclase [Candidatus Limnocylindria bacterium]
MADGPSIRERLGWPPSPELHRKIRRLWQRHSIAEDRRDIDELIATLTPDCVYELAAANQRWEGHQGAREFYGTLFAAFPDNRFDLTDIVIGPQGVMEVATLTATHRGPFAGLPPTGRPVRLTVVIHFPWDPEAELFTGERIYLDRGELG